MLNQFQNDNPIHVITVPEHIRTEKPPEYETCIVQPPSYDDAVQLSPAAFLNIASPITRTLSPPQLLAPSYEVACCTSPPSIAQNTSANVCPAIRPAPTMATINVCHVTCVAATPIQVDK